jgi:hypothetical protein
MTIEQQLSKALADLVLMMRERDKVANELAIATMTAKTNLQRYEYVTGQISLLLGSISTMKKGLGIE